jgi:glutathione reductase (NADPH)
MNSYDLVVIGGGSGGVRAARIAAQHGAKVALIESYRLGGTCVIRGCVPKKLMVYASRFAQEFEESAGFGWTVGMTHFDWAQLKAHRDAEVNRLEKIYASNLLKSGVDIFQAKAKIKDQHTVVLDTNKELKTKNILIATGASPSESPPFPGHEWTMDSNDFFQLERQPQTVVLQGAGYIALEFACLLRLLGSGVHVVVRGKEILRGFDHDVQAHLLDELVRAGIVFHFQEEISKITQDQNNFCVTLTDASDIHADAIIRAIGRRPNSQHLGLEALGVGINPQGAVLVNDDHQTTVPNIYAVGDVTNRVNLTPMAIREGHRFADALFGSSKQDINYDIVPTAIFTTPEAGVVGLTEAQALQAAPNLDVYLSNFRPMKATLSGHSGKVLMKVLVCRDTDRVLGFHAVGPDSGEMVQLLAISLQMGLTKKVLDQTLAVHPTAAEEWVTMRSPTRQFHKGHQR